MAIFDIFKKKGKGTTTATPTTTDAPHKGGAGTTDGPPKRPTPGGTNGAVPDPTTKTPEELCGVQPDMPREEIRTHLAKLFKRHNRGASSLDESTRQSAEIMLDAIVEVRGKYLN
ncbi:MAG: hypothetical protein AAGJ79_01065 [Verrucomicrobiota bacterium]